MTSSDRASQSPPSTNRTELLAALGARRTEFKAFVRRRVRAGVDPDDVVQQALLLAARGIGSLRDPARLIPWFYRVLRRLIADGHVKAARSQASSVCEEGSFAAETFPCDCAIAALTGLPSAYAEVLRRVYFEDEEPSAVARALGTTTNNVTVRLYRARDALRRRLRDRCGTESSRACADCSC